MPVVVGGLLLAAAAAAVAARHRRWAFASGSSGFLAGDHAAAAAANERGLDQERHHGRARGAHGKEVQEDRLAVSEALAPEDQSGVFGLEKAPAHEHA